MFVGGLTIRLFELQGALYRGLEVQGKPRRFVPAGSTGESEEIEDAAEVTISADWAMGYYHEKQVVPCWQLQAGLWHPAVPGYRFVFAEALEDFTAGGQVGQMRWEAPDSITVEEAVRTPFLPDISVGDQDIGCLWNDTEQEWQALLQACE